jgi:hypothetical protein
MTLIPTHRRDVFHVGLNLRSETRHIGTLDFSGEGTFYSKKSQKHLLRKENSLGINVELLERFAFRWIVIEYCGEQLVTTKAFFLAHSRIHRFDKAGFEKQRFLELRRWGKEKAVEFEQRRGEQGDLFSAA